MLERLTCSLKMYHGFLTSTIILQSVFIFCKSEKTWMFSVGGNRKPANFIDTDGYLKGADVDLIKSVCEIANKRCEITVQPFEECVRTVRDRIYPGIGIMSKWYDACVGYVSIPERLNSMAFTDAYANAVATFTVLKGNPRNFNPDNVSESVITTLNGLFTSSPCLKRLNKVPKGIIVAADLNKVKDLLNNGSADALFSPRTLIPGYDVLPARYDCTTSGLGMMVRKDNELPGWWNPAFQSFYKSGNYTVWCKTINQKYGGIRIDDSYCLPPPAVKPTASGSGTQPGQIVGRR
ncbi:putative histidine-binding protein [Mytilus galloprovincialis]|uniref:putative histidine-binding protein n=1 Tax=Mytilus galloprovincialis TaxID=29158 RepID=UPI003F7BD022